MSKNKIPRSVSMDRVQKNPTIAKSLESEDDQHPVWQFSLMDIYGKWGWKNNKNLLEVQKKLCEYEKRTWQEIKSNHKREHSVSINILTKEARDRLHEIHNEDIDEIFRLRLNGTQRI